ncbi:MAG: polyamine aminopropyltransferase [Alphaproteobacteria bacterium]|nr:polyamine aminopropyltransferase [Alphaproteobacteria bacterium]
MSRDTSFLENAHAIYPFPGTKAFQGFEINKCLFETQSPFQHIALYDNDTLGRVLVLDGAVQITSADEFIYQEMMAHVPLFSHENPENVLIIGGGDGGILREVLRHKSVRKAVMVEIDRAVIDTCIQYMPEINEGGAVFNDPRTALIIQDASLYIKETTQSFDCIIIDSTDPIGPGEKLFTPAFYEDLAKILNPGGFIVTQSGVPFFQQDESAVTLSALKQAGLHARCFITAQPTYYGGYLALGFATNRPEDQALPTLEALQARYKDVA